MPKAAERERVRFDTQSILPSGTSRVPTHPTRGELGLNTVPVYDIVGHNATYFHLEGEFLRARAGCEHGGTVPLFDRPIKILSPLSNSDKEIVEARLMVVNNAAGYSELSSLIVIAPFPETSEYVLRRTNDAWERVNAIDPSALKTRSQTAYTLAKLAGLQTAWQQQEGTALVVEHRTPMVTQKGTALPRTIPLPHATVLVVDDEHIVGQPPQSPKFDHLFVEQDLLKPRMEQLALQAQSGIRRRLFGSGLDPRHVSVNSRNGEPPIGYSVHFDITPDELTDPKAVRYVTTTLDAEHEIYTKASQALAEQLPDPARRGNDIFRQKPQPARRQILHIAGNHLVAVTSPIVYSHAGGFEASNVLLDRDPRHPRIHSEEKVEIYNGNVARNIKNTITRFGLA